MHSFGNIKYFNKLFKIFYMYVSYVDIRYDRGASYLSEFFPTIWFLYSSYDGRDCNEFFFLNKKTNELIKIEYFDLVKCLSLKWMRLGLISKCNYTWTFVLVYIEIIKSLIKSNAKILLLIMIGLQLISF